MTDILIVSTEAAELAPLIPGSSAFDDPDSVPDELLGARILLADPTAAARLAPDMPSLQWIQSTWAGVDALLAAGVPPGVTVTSLKEVFGSQMREFVFGHLLAHTQDIVVRTSGRSWDPYPPPVLAGSRLGILGTGSIGAAIARTAVHLGMAVVGCSRSGSQVEPFERVFSVERRLEFATGLHHLVVVLPATAESANVVDAALLEQLSPGATLINVGRGSTVDVGAVVAALREGRLALAVLDVLPNEPLPDGDPLWEEPGLVITSHTAAYSRPQDVASFFLANLDHHRAGESLVGIVDLEAGY